MHPATVNICSALRYTSRCCRANASRSLRQEDSKLEETWKKRAVASLSRALTVEPSAHAPFHSEDFLGSATQSCTKPIFHRCPHLYEVMAARYGERHSSSPEKGG